MRNHCHCRTYRIHNPSPRAVLLAGFIATLLAMLLLSGCSSPKAKVTTISGGAKVVAGIHPVIAPSDPSNGSSDPSSPSSVAVESEVKSNRAMAAAGDKQWASEPKDPSFWKNQNGQKQSQTVLGEQSDQVVNTSKRNGYFFAVGCEAEVPGGSNHRGRSFYNNETIVRYGMPDRVVSGQDTPPIPPRHEFYFTDNRPGGKWKRSFSGGSSSYNQSYNPYTGETMIQSSTSSYSYDSGGRWEDPFGGKNTYRLGDGFNSPYATGQYPSTRSHSATSQEPPRGELKQKLHKLFN